MATRHSPRRLARETAPVAGLALGLGAVILGTALIGARRRHSLERVRLYPDSAPDPARRAVAGGR